MWQPINYRCTEHVHVLAKFACACIYQRPILTISNETLFPQQHLSFARERAETLMPCKQSSTCAVEQVDADMACVTSVEQALAYAYTLDISPASCQNNAGCLQPLTWDSAHVDEG